MSPATAQRTPASFRHGVHPAEHKEATEKLAIARMPFVDEYVLPLSQHLGKPARPLVLKGDRVQRGQMIGGADGFVSTAIHSPVTGTVRAVEQRPHPSGGRKLAIVIGADPYDSQRAIVGEAPRLELPSPETIRLIQEAGIVGLGGAAFPSHVKLSVPKGKRVRSVLLNGCECEPYLTCDHLTMVERAQEVVDGHVIIMRQVGAERGYIGIERNKPDAIDALHRFAKEASLPIEVVPLKVKYPQGAEKMLVDAILAKEVPAGGLPLDLEMVVQNVGTAVAVSELFATGKPLIERAVSITGPGVSRPANLLVPIGTPIGDVIEFCGGLHPDTRQVILGGPMMGQAQKSLEVPVMKGTSGILALTVPERLIEEQPCIRCGRCLHACPMFLNPSRLAILARNERAEELKSTKVMSCFECGSCTFVCPSGIPIVQLIRVGKAIVRQKDAAK